MSLTDIKRHSFSIICGVMNSHILNIMSNFQFYVCQLVLKGKYMVNLCISATQFQSGFPGISILPALAISDIGDFVNSCSVVIYSEMCDSYIVVFATALVPIYFFFYFSFTWCSHLTLICRYVSNGAFHNATEVWWLFYLTYTIALYAHHTYSIEM